MHAPPSMQSCTVALVVFFLIAANTDEAFVVDRTILANHHFAFRSWAMKACTQLSWIFTTKKRANPKQQAWKQCAKHSGQVPYFLVVPDVPRGSVSELACRRSRVHKRPRSPPRKVSKYRRKNTAGNTGSKRRSHNSSYALFLISTCAGHFLPVDERSVELGGSAAAKHGTDEGSEFY